MHTTVTICTQDIILYIIVIYTCRERSTCVLHGGWLVGVGQRLRRVGAGFGRAPHADVVHHDVARRDGEAKLLHVPEGESKGWAGNTKHLHIIR